MANTTIQLKYSTSPGTSPSSLANGEVAINTNDGKLFYSNPAGVVQTIALGVSTPSGLNKEIQFNDNGVLGANASLTFDKATGTFSTNIIKSTVATGTAPINVSSTTAVANLNADLLDGNHADAFYLATNPSGFTNNTGTVTSVGGTGTVSGITLSGTVTTSGSLSLSGTLVVEANNFSSQAANAFLAAPNGAAGVPTFRSIVAADIPTLNQNTTGTASNVTGTVAVGNGGTGQTSLTTNNVILGNGASAVQFVAPGTTGNVLTSDGTTWISAAPSATGGPSTYSTTIGDGSATSYTVTHSLNKSNVLVSVRENITNGYFVYPDIKYSSVNAIILEFATTPTTNQYLVSVVAF